MRPCISAFSVLALGFSAASSDASELEYRVSGAFEDGSLIEGIFVFEDAAADQSSIDGLGYYTALRHDVTLTNSTLFSSREPFSTSGRSTRVDYDLNERFQTQIITIFFLSDVGNNGAFVDMSFDSFTGDADVFNPLNTDAFVVAGADGSGVAGFTRFNIALVPEPTGLACLSLGGLLLIRRSRR